MQENWTQRCSATAKLFQSGRYNGIWLDGHYFLWSNNFGKKERIWKCLMRCIFNVKKTYAGWHLLLFVIQIRAKCHCSYFMFLKSPEIAQIDWIQNDFLLLNQKYFRSSTWKWMSSVAFYLKWIYLLRIEFHRISAFLGHSFWIFCFDLGPKKFLLLDSPIPPANPRDQILPISNLFDSLRSFWNNKAKWFAITFQFSMKLSHLLNYIRNWKIFLNAVSVILNFLMQIEVVSNNSWSILSDFMRSHSFGLLKIIFGSWMWPS